MPMSDTKHTRDRRGRDDDMPIIGDFSAASDFGARPASSPPPAAPPEAPAPMAAQRSVRSPPEPLRPDPRDMARYARRNRGRKTRAPFGPLRLMVALLVAVAAGVGVYLNYEPLRASAMEWLALARSAVTPPETTVGPGSSADDPQAIVVEPPVVAGTPEAPAGAPDSARAETPSRVEAPPASAEPGPVVARSAPDAEASPESLAPAPAAPADAVPEAAAAAPLRPEPPAPAPLPPAPPVPEVFEFATQVVSVSERQAGAAVVVRRSGGTLAESSVVWWVSGGSATSGNDFADLGAIVEKFGAGERARTIHVPIVGDSTREASESFYVNLGEAGPAGAEPAQRVEVVIEDDD
jgi:hypothetical protein